MADETNGARYLPVLAFLLFALMLSAGVKLYISEADRSRSEIESTAIVSLAYAQAANLQARIALGGADEAFAALAETRRGLNSIDAAKLSPAQRDRLLLTRSSIDELLEGQEDIRALHAAADTLAEVVGRFTETLYLLEEETALAPPPALGAHLGRLRLLAEGQLANAQALARGANEPPESSRKMLDSEVELNQIVQGLRTGDAQMAISPIAGEAAEQMVDRLAGLSGEMASSVQNMLTISDRVIAIRQANRQLDDVALEPEIVAVLAGLQVGSKPQSSALSFSMPPRIDQLTHPLLLLSLAGLVFLTMVWIYHRAASSRKATVRLAAQTEQDQEAILRLLDELGSLADGDLTVRVTVGEDVTGAIADSVNYAVEALRDLVMTISDSAILVDGEAKQTEVSARQLGAASDAQRRQIKAASDLMAQMAASVDEVSGNAKRSSDVARHSVDVAHKGGNAVRRTIEGMNTIRETIQDTSKRIKRLGESSQEIGDIVELINDIAEQTNILALNASIQASMAGEAGRGFAVVADEVQRLAERSANATKQIEVLVRTIQSDTNEAVVSMERSTTDVVGGALLAENAGASLEEIEQVSNQIAMLVQNISGSAREQSNAAQGILRNMGQLEKISAQTDQSTSATTASISKLSQLASELRRSIAGFRLPDLNSASMALENVEVENVPADVEHEQTQKLIVEKTA